MWATEGHPEHKGITGVTFSSDGHRLAGTFCLARGDEPKPAALLLHGCHAFAWHRGQLRVLIACWLDEATRDEMDQGA